MIRKFVLGCRFNLKAYAKNVREKATKGSLKTAEVLLDADRHALFILIKVQCSKSF